MAKGGRKKGKRGRGRDPAVTCANCGRSVPRSKAVVFVKNVRYSTDLKEGDNVQYVEKRKVYYCVSCAKHFGIFEKKKKRYMSKYNQ